MKGKLLKPGKEELVDTLIEIYDSGDDVVRGMIETLAEKDDLGSLKAMKDMIKKSRITVRGNSRLLPLQRNISILFLYTLLLTATAGSHV